MNTPAATLKTQHGAQHYGPKCARAMFPDLQKPRKAPKPARAVQDERQTDWVEMAA
jgi:hypothetical protein